MHGPNVGGASFPSNRTESLGAAEVAARLAATRRDWLPRVFPGGKFERGAFLLGDAHGAAGRSLPVPLDSRRRKFADFGSGWRGDDLDLLAAGTGVDAAGAYRAGLELLGEWREGAGKKASSDITSFTRPPEEPPPLLEDPGEPVGSSPSTNERAQEIWRQTVAIPKGSLGERYLVDVRKLPAWDSDRLRWHPQCPWGADRVGCIVAPITSPITGMTIAIWRIWPSLTEAMTERRKGLGKYGGGAARLYWADADRVAVAEGVEDSVALHELTGWPAWAALNAGNMAALVLPERFRRVLICQDADPPNAQGHRPGPEAAQALAHRLTTEGRDVEIIQARGAKDPNALLQQRTAS